MTIETNGVLHCYMKEKQTHIGNVILFHYLALQKNATAYLYVSHVNTGEGSLLSPIIILYIYSKVSFDQVI